MLALILLVSVAAAPPNLGSFTYDQRIGRAIPLDRQFRDEAGRSVRFGDLLVGRPAILVLGYFHCPNLCGFVRADLYDALTRTGLSAGADYTLIALSIDPSETPADAAQARRGDLARFSVPGDAASLHYLTGDATAIHAVSGAAGFRDRFDPDTKQFLHPAGLVFVTPRGVISGYLLGLGYKPGDVRLGLTRASTGSLAAAASPVLLLCFHFDPTTGRYTLAVLKLLKLGAAITVLVLGGALYLAFRRERRPSP